MKRFFKSLGGHPRLSWFIRQHSALVLIWLKITAIFFDTDDGKKDFFDSVSKRRRFFHGYEQDNGVLYAFYDLSVCYVTFDILVFLLTAEYERRKRGLRSIQLVIAPGPLEGFRHIPETAKWKNTLDETRWRLDNILIASARLIPSIQGVAVLSSRRDVAALYFASGSPRHIFPPEYDFRKPKYRDIISSPRRIIEANRKHNTNIQYFACRSSARSQVSRDLDREHRGRKIVTITLRQSDNQVSRNSSIEDWAALAHQLADDARSVVVLRDVEYGRLPEEFDRSKVCEYIPALSNLELRCALYEQAHLNLFVNNGPAAFAHFSPFCSFLIFKMLNEGSRVTGAEHLRKIGFEPGEQPLHYGDNQKIVWENDHLEVMIREVAAMEKILDRSAADHFDSGYYRQQVGGAFPEIGQITEDELFQHYQTHVRSTVASPNRRFDEAEARRLCEELDRAVLEGIVDSAFHHHLLRGG